MHNTRSAIASLVNRYKAVLKKCHLLNTFGSLALATSLVTGAVGGVSGLTGLGGLDFVGTAHADGATVDYTPILSSSLYKNGIYADLIKGELELLGTTAMPGGTLTWEDYIINTGAYTNWDAYVGTVATLFEDLAEPVSPAYVVTPGVTLNNSNYYTTFTIYSVSSDSSAYTITGTNYGALLKNDYASDPRSTEATIQDIITSYLNNYESDNGTKIDTTGIDYSIDGVNFSASNNDSPETTKVSYTASTSNAIDISNTSIITADPDTTSAYTISSNFVDIKTNTYNGGAIELRNESSTEDIYITSISGDFIGNEVTVVNGTEAGNGGAIALFSNNNKQDGGSGSIIVDSITGDFIGNTAARVGGAIYLFSNYGSISKINSITGDFVGNTAALGAGAIANYEGEIGTISGDFIGNTASALGGGAIDNLVWSNVGGHTATIDSIEGNFIGNTAGTEGDGTTATTIANGGAIRNFAYSYSTDANEDGAAIIGDIIANFYGNTATGDGGAIYNYAHSASTNPNVVNTAIISTITGDFIGNTAGGSGGAIYNDDNYDSIALIGIITGDFIYNIAGVYGGAIYNTSQISYVNGNFINNSSASGGGAIYNYGNGDVASIGDIDGDFIGNTITNTWSCGGAIFNIAGGGTASIGNITGNFYGNAVTGANSVGGAIANYAAIDTASASIGDITGDFIYNTATKYGGAIYNDSNDMDTSTIDSITGDFLYNGINGTVTTYDETGGSTESYTEGKVQGGAIYNNDYIGYIEGSFIGNYVIGNKDSTSVAGGAVYTTADMTFTATNQTNYFSNNYIEYYNDDDVTTTKDYNAIYVDVDTVTEGASISDIELQFIMSGTGSFVVNDSIIGNAEYTQEESITYVSSVTATAPIEPTVPDGTTTISINVDSGSAIYFVTGTYSQTEKVVTSTETTTTYYITVTETGDGTNSTTTYSVTKITEKAVSETTTDGTLTASSSSTTTTYELTESSSTEKITLTESEYEVFETNATNTTKGTTSSSKEVTTTTTETVTDSSTSDTATYKTVDIDGVTTSTTVTVNTTTANSDGVVKDIYYTYTLASGSTATLKQGVTTNMTGDSAFNVTITGNDKEKNIFYLRDEITNFGDFIITDATLYLSSYDHGDQITKGSLTALDSDSSVTFGSGSQLTIDMSAYSDSMSDDGTIRTKAVLQGNGASLTVDPSSTLSLVKATTGNTFTILSGFTVENTSDIQSDADGSAAWVMGKVSIDSDLQDAIIVRNGYDDLYEEGDIAADPTSYDASAPVYYVISVTASTDSPLYDSTVGEIVYNAASDSGFGHDSDIAGERYYYDISTIPDDKEEVAVAEGTAGLDKVAGVPMATYRVNRLSSDALSSRLSNMGDTDTVLATYVPQSSDSLGAGANGGADGDADGGLAKLPKKHESVALWFVPMYAHDRTRGASIAGYDADFHTNIYGGVVGVDKTIADGGDNALGADLYRVGVAVNAGMGDVTASGDFDGVENDFNFGGAFVYAVVEYGNLTISADAGFNKVYSEVEQDLSRYGFAGTKADVHSTAWSADLYATYRIDAGGLHINPYVGAEFVSLKTEDYDVKRTDAAGGTIYNISSDRQNIVSVPVGLKFDTDIHTASGWTITPQVSVGVIFAMGELNEHSLITMPGVAGSGRTDIQVVDEVTLDVSAGVAVIRGNWCFGLDYELQRSTHRIGHGLTGLIQYRF